MTMFIRCSLVMLILALASISFADEHFPFVGVIKKGPVNVRAGANTNFEIVDKLSQGADVLVLAKYFEWYKIQAPSSTAVFIRADYIKERAKGIGQVIGDKVNLRCKPKAESSMLGQVVTGDLVRLIEKTDNWWKIGPTSKTVAWVYADFVALKSTVVTDTQLIKPLTEEDIKALEEAVKPAPAAAVAPVVESQGVIKAWPESTDAHIHYQLVTDGKPVYYLQDAVFLDHFLNAHVKIEGDLVHEAAPVTTPVLKVKKVLLLL